ncbi:MAG: tRNA (adenosine(37)-N6)-dimethylallyltransferase MiaA, partial [Phycisphaerae bacterium]|nr:tRNA (adenosine(37)-N6)-dimethylallyltransferase MiaA [Phycisphaerae bacterium]
IFVGLRRAKDDLKRRINARVKRMVAAGLEQEVAALLEEPAGLSDQAAAAVGYAEMIAYLRGRTTREEAIERIKINTRRLAKKQRTWHRRWRDVCWFDLAEDADAEAVAQDILRSVDFGRGR